MAYAVTSLLESPASSDRNDGQAENHDPNLGNNATASSSAANSGEKPRGHASVTDVHQRLYDNFWVAYDSLDMKRNNTHLLRRGIQLAKDMQEAIVRVGNDLIEKREVKLHKNFRYLIMENAYLKETQLFQYPLALQKIRF